MTTAESTTVIEANARDSCLADRKLFPAPPESSSSAITHVCAGQQY